jgi:hypothetical protein
MEKEQTSTGIKDRHLLHFLDELRSVYDEAQRANLGAEATIAELHRVRNNWQNNEMLFNPAFAFPGNSAFLLYRSRLT